MPDPQAVAASNPAAHWYAPLSDAIRQAHAAARAQFGDPLPAVVTEAFAEASVTATALRCVRDTRLPRADAAHPGVLSDIVARRLAELACATVGELAVAVRSWAYGAGHVLEEAGRAGLDPAQWAARLASADPRPAVAVLLDSAALPGHRAADLHESLRARCAQLRAGLDTEWDGAANVVRAALPLLTRPVADIAVAMAMGADEHCPDVVIRRFVYRRFAEAVPEGLTPRHLERSRAIVDEAVGEAVGGMR